MKEVFVLPALPFPFPLDSRDMLKKRAFILTTLCAADEGFCQTPVVSIRRETPVTMFQLYDQIFLDGTLSRAYGRLDVTLSSRLTSAAGKFISARDPALKMERAEIRLSSDFLFQLREGPFQLIGLSVATPQEAFLVVFEHELCHALETALYGSTGHSSRFLSLANGLFGHTGIRHSLPTRKQIAAQNGIAVGKVVSFPYEGRTLRGTITYVGKTATVMVPDRRGDYRNAQGRRYSKYRLSLDLLQF